MNTTVSNAPLSMAEKWNNRALYKLLWPLIIEQILAVTMGAADTLMVSRVGEHAVSAVNIIDNINNLLIIAFTAMSTGGAVVVSQYIGRHDPANARNASKQLVYLVVMISVAIAACAISFRRPIIRFIYGHVEDKVMSEAALFFFISALSYPFLAMYNANAALLRASGNTMFPMRIALIANIMNISGNVLLIYKLNLGVLGSGISTLTCRIMAAAVTTTILTRKNSGAVSLSGLFHIRFSRSQSRNILNVGLPGGIESSMFQIGKLLTQRIFTVFGTGAMAANAIAGVVNSFTFMPGTALGLAMITIVGQCVGAGDYPEAQRQTKKLMMLTYIIMFAVSATIYIFLDPFVSLFKLSPEAHNMARSFLRIHCISMAIGWPISFGLPNALRASGDVRYVMWAATISMWTVRVIAAYVFTFTLKLGPLGVWLAMGADFMVRGTAYTLRWFSGKWKNKIVIHE